MALFFYHWFIFGVCTAVFTYALEPVIDGLYFAHVKAQGMGEVEKIPNRSFFQRYVIETLLMVILWPLVWAMCIYLVGSHLANRSRSNKEKRQA